MYSNEMQLAIAELKLAEIRAALTVMSGNVSKELAELLNKAADTVEKAENRVVIERVMNR